MLDTPTTRYAVRLILDRIDRTADSSETTLLDAALLFDSRSSASVARVFEMLIRLAQQQTDGGVADAVL